MAIDTVYHFADPDLGVEIFCKKEEATEKGCVDFLNKVLRHLCTLVLGL